MWLLGLLLRCISLCCSNKHATCVGDRSTAHSTQQPAFDMTVVGWHHGKLGKRICTGAIYRPSHLRLAHAQLQSFQQRGGGKSSDFVVLGPQWVWWQRGIPSWIWHFPAGVQLPARPGHSGEDFRTADSWPMASIVRDRDLEDVERTCTQVGMGHNPGTPMSIPKMNRIVFTHVGGDNIDPWPHRPWIILSKRTGFQWQLRYGPEEDFPYWPNCGATYLGFSWLQLAFRTGPASRWQGWHRCNHRASKTIDY